QRQCLKRQRGSEDVPRNRQVDRAAAELPRRDQGDRGARDPLGGVCTVITGGEKNGSATFSGGEALLSCCHPAIRRRSVTLDRRANDGGCLPRRIHRKMLFESPPASECERGLTNATAQCIPGQSRSQYRVARLALSATCWDRRFSRCSSASYPSRLLVYGPAICNGIHRRQ